MANVPLSKSVPHIYVPSLSLPQIRAKHITVPHLSTPGKSNQTVKKRRLHVRDLGDLVLGNPFTGTLQLQHTLEDADLGHLTHIPILNRIAGAGVMLQERVVEPIVEGEPLKALVNSLETVGNSLDIVANPVKALLPVAGGGTYQDFLKSMGWDPNSYREIYQWDTGNFLFDLAGEIVSDPINWFTLGGKTAAKEIIDGMADSVVKVIAKEYGEEAAQSISRKMVDDIVVQMGKITTDSNNDSVVRLFTELNRKRFQLAQELKALPKNSDAYRLAKQNLNQLTQGLTLKDADSFIDTLHKLRTDDLYKVYRKVTTPINVADKIDRNLLKASMWLTPFGPAWEAGKITVSKVFPTIFNKAFMRLKDFDLTNGINNNAAIVREINKYIEPTVKSVYRDTFDALEPILKKYGVTFERLQKMYMNIIHNTPDITEAEELFMEQLLRKVPDLRHVTAEGINTMLEGVRPANLDDLLMAIRETSLTASSFEAYVKNIDRITATNKATKIINELDIPFSLNTLQNQIAMTNVKEGISNVKPSIRRVFEVIDNTAKAEDAIALKQSLTTLGITKDNVDSVVQLYDSYLKGNKKALDDLKAILIKAKTKELVTANEAVDVLKGSNIGPKELKTLLNETKQSITNDQTLDELFEKHNVTEQEVREAIDNLELEINNVNNIKATVQTWTTSHSIDLDKYYTNLNALTGDDYSKYLQDVFDYKLNVNDMDSIRQYLDNLNVLKTKLVEIKNAIYARQVQGIIPDNKYTTYMLDNIDDLLTRLNAFNIDDNLKRFLAAVSENKTYYFEILSAEGRFYLTQQALLHDLGSNQEWYIKLSETYGDLRTTLKNIMNKLDNTNDGANAFLEDLKQILLAIDSSNNLTITRKYLQDVLDTVPLSKADKEYLVNSFINTLYKHGDENVSQMLFNESDTLIASYMDDFILDIKPNLDVNVADSIQEQIEEIASNMFNKYLIEQAHIADNLNVVSSNVYHIVTGETVDAMQRLGFNVDDVVNVLLDAKVAVDDISIVVDTVNRLSTGIESNTLRQANKYLNTYLRNTGDVDGFIKLTHVLNDKVINDDSVSEVLKRVYEDIYAINADLAGYGQVLGSTDTKYPSDKTLNSIIRFVSASKANEFVRNTTGRSNVYSYMNANRFFGVRKVIDTPFRKTHRLTAEYLNTTTPQHYVLLRNLETAYYRMSKRIAQSSPEIELIRQALIKHYSNSAIAFGPKDATRYFLDASPVDVLAWDMATQNKGLGAKESSAYLNIFREFKQRTTVKHKLDRRVNDIYNTLDDKLDKTLDIEMDDYTALIDKVDHRSLDIITDTFRKDINKLIKDATSLSVYQDDLLNYIKNDGDAVTNVTKLNKLTNNKATVIKTLGSEYNEHSETLRSNGIFDKTPMSSDRISRFANLERENSLYLSIKSFNTKQLRSWIDRNVNGWFLVVDPTGTFEAKHTAEALKEAGLIMQRLDDAEDILFIRRIDNTLTNNSYEYIKTKYIFKEYQQQITDVIRNNRAYVAYENIDIPDELWDGHMMDGVVYDSIASHPSINKLLGTEAERKAYLFFDENGLNSFYTKSKSRPNLLVVGVPGAYNRVLDITKAQFSARNIYQIYKKMDLIKNVYTGSLSAIKRVNKIHKYLQLFFNEDFYIGAQPFRKVLTGASDAELQQLFRRNNFVAAILKQDSKGNPVVYKIRIANQKHLQDAIKAKAIIIPNETYINMVLSINKQKLDSKILNLYMRTIVGTYKTIYLHSVGFLFRNAADSLIYKNAAATDGVLGVLDNFKYEYRAMKMLQMYDDITKEALEIVKQNPSRKYNKYLINEVLSTKDLETQSMYKLVDMFIDTGASGGYIKSFKEYLLTYNKEMSGTSGFVWEQFWNERIMEFPTVKVLNDANETIEQSARFGLFLKLIDEGEDYTSAIRKVIDTHFNYNLKEPGVELLEQIFWFATFPINNVMFYINEGLTKNPELLKIQMDALELSYNNNGYTWDDVRNSDYLTYNALAGNLRVYTKDNNRIVLKLGSSVLDFLNVIANPFGEAQERLNPFLSVLFGLEDINQLNPLTTPVNRFKQIKSGQSYIPSVYTQLYPKYKRPHYIERAPYTKRTWTKYPKRHYFKKPNNVRAVMYKYMTDRYYFRKGPNKHYWLTSTNAVDPTWYTNSARYKRYNRAYNRKLKNYYKTR